jgi:AhpD family alkylhydroperoxidase
MTTSPPPRGRPRSCAGRCPRVGSCPTSSGWLTLATLERIALAVAEYHRSEPGVATHSRTARASGLTLDEVALARRFESADPREAALLRYLHAMLEQGRPEMHLHEEAREAGWDDEQILEAIAAVNLEAFSAMVNVAGEVPIDGSAEAARALEAA